MICPCNKSLGSGLLWFVPSVLPPHRVVASLLCLFEAWHLMSRYIPFAEHLTWSSFPLSRTRRTSQVAGMPFLKGSLLSASTNRDDDSGRSYPLVLDFLCKELKCLWDVSIAIIFVGTPVVPICGRSFPSHLPSSCSDSLQLSRVTHCPPSLILGLRGCLSSSASL